MQHICMPCPPSPPASVCQLIHMHHICTPTRPQAMYPHTCTHPSQVSVFCMLIHVHKPCTCMPACPCHHPHHVGIFFSPFCCFFLYTNLCPLSNQVSFSCSCFTLIWAHASACIHTNTSTSPGYDKYLNKCIYFHCNA